jgi:hypothetical protein
MSVASKDVSAGTNGLGGVGGPALMRHWGDFGLQNRRLWTGDFGSGVTTGLRKSLAPGVVVRSDVNHTDMSSVNSVTVSDVSGKGTQGCKGTLGLTVGDLGDAARNPSAFGKLMIPWSSLANNGSKGSLTFRLNKAWWRAMPYVGIDYKQQFANLAIATSVGADLGTRMNQCAEERKGLQEWEITHSATTGSGPFAIGGQVKYALDNGDLRFTDYNLGVDWVSREKYGVGVHTEDRMRHLVGTTWGDVNRNARLGSIYSYDTQNGVSKSGVVMQFSDDAGRIRVKAKADTRGEIAGSLFAKLTDDNLGLRAHVNASYNLIEQNAPRAGFGLSVGDF